MNFDKLWVEKYRPKTLKDILLSEKNRKFFEELAAKEVKTIPHLMFHGPWGTGKTSLAKIIIEDILKCEYLYINGSEQNSIDTVRGLITNFIETKSMDGQKKVVLLDEADGLSSAGGAGSNAQKALRDILESYLDYSRFIFTCNYNHQIIKPIWSRVMEFRIVPDKKDYIARALMVLKNEGISVPPEHKEKLLTLINDCYPDLRLVINELQKASITDTFEPPETSIRESEVLAELCLVAICKKKELSKLRKYITDNDEKFMGDYNVLLKSFFEVTYKSNIPDVKKKQILLVISEGLYYDRIVLDKEINFHATCIKVGDIING